MRRVAITGISGYIGSQLLSRLAVHPEVESILGVDLVPPRVESPKLHFFRRDLARPLDGLFTKEQVDTVIHLAFVVKPVRDVGGAARTNVEGTHQVIREVRKSGVKHVVYLGSTAAYGAHPDNPVPLIETSPLRPNKGFHYSQNKAETDQAFQSLSRADRSIVVTVLRGCVVLGPGGKRSVGAKMFTPVMVRIAGCDPPVQYVHEEDLAGSLVAALEQRPKGVFNLAAPGTLPYSQVADIAHKRMVTVPKQVLAATLDATWALRLQSESTSHGLDFIAYPWVADNVSFQKKTGFKYHYSSEDALRSYLRRET